MAAEYKATVRIMNSYDYSHFEVTLGSEQPLDAEGVNKMRAEAQRLVDIAIHDYKKAQGVIVDDSQLEPYKDGDQIPF